MRSSAQGQTSDVTCMTSAEQGKAVNSRRHGTPAHTLLRASWSAKAVTLAPMLTWVSVTVSASGRARATHASKSTGAAALQPAPSEAPCMRQTPWLNPLIGPDIAEHSMPG